MPVFYLAIGHIAEDLLPDGSTTPGGTVSFSALTARNLGHKAAILTAAPAYFRSLPVFENIEIAGPIAEKATRFENIYTPQGRVQYVRAVAPVITPSDVPPEWQTAAQIVHLGPIAQECSVELVDLFPNALIGVTPQGWMREWNNSEGRVLAIPWRRAYEILSKSHALVLSDEDLPPGEEGQALFQSYVNICPVVARTHGEGGSSVYWEGKSQHVDAFPAKEVDPTGAGDVFATAFFLKLFESKDPVAAARFANAAAAVNIERPGTSGAPFLAEVEARLQR